MSALKKPQAAPPSSTDELPRSAALLDMCLDELAEFCDPMSLSEADGFLAGIAVCPDPVGIEEWLPFILNLGPEAKIEAFVEPEQAESLAALLLKGFNRVSDELARGAYMPIADRYARDQMEFWHPWISGFAQAMALRPASWDRFALGDNLTRNALKGLRNLIKVKQGGADTLPENHDVMSALAPMLIPVWVGILQSWRVSGSSADYFAPPPLGLTAAPGRNDPCSCGSGKKYKKCCYLS